MRPTGLANRLQESLIALPFGQRREMLQQHFEKLEVRRAGFFIWVEVGLGKIGLWIGCDAVFASQCLRVSRRESEQIAESSYQIASMSTSIILKYPQAFHELVVSSRHVDVGISGLFLLASGICICRDPCSHWRA